MTSLVELLRTTTVRWSGAIALALLIQSAVLCGLIYWWTVRQAESQIDGRLVADCATFARLRPHALNAAIDGMVAADLHRTHLAAVFAPDGRVLAGNIAALPRELLAHTVPVSVGLVRSQPPNPLPDLSRTIACPIAGGGHVVFAEDMDGLTRLRQLIERALLLVTAPAGAIAIVLGICLSLRAQTRFRIVRKAVEDVMAGKLQRRLPVHSAPDPFGRLCSAVNAMLDRLEEAVDDLRALGDDIAHELRTPLTRLRARLERGYQDARTPDEFRDAGERTLRDIDQALSIVSAILRLREIDDGKRAANFTRVDVAALMRDAAELYLPSAEMYGISLRVDDSPAADCFADHDLLMEAVCNLIDNAVKFTPPGGVVRCELRGENGVARAIRITDTGRGISRSEREVVLRRFHRGSQHSAVAGHGIGLALVAAIVRLHGFSMRIEDAKPGCDVTILCDAS
ncbi:ATP-binding protein [Acidocella sp.]|uniref:ATP-binding protein n=1 Tax=Acidocella sp. TaxID=50710 RepID=UPI002F413F11